MYFCRVWNYDDGQLLVFLDKSEDDRGYDLKYCSYLEDHGVVCSVEPYKSYEDVLDAIDGISENTARKCFNTIGKFS